LQRRQHTGQAHRRAAILVTPRERAVVSPHQLLAHWRRAPQPENRRFPRFRRAQSTSNRRGYGQAALEQEIEVWLQLAMVIATTKLFQSAAVL
jgi:hypothetical protein